MFMRTRGLGMRPVHALLPRDIKPQHTHYISDIDSVLSVNLSLWDTRPSVACIRGHLYVWFNRSPSLWLEIIAVAAMATVIGNGNLWEKMAVEDNND